MIGEDRDHPLGELPKFILNLFQNYVEYQRKYTDCIEMNRGGKSILDFKKEWDNCESNSSKFDLMKKCSKPDSQEHEVWRNHFDESDWFEQKLPSMFNKMFDQIITKVSKLIRNADSNVLSKYPNLQEWLEREDKYESFSSESKALSDLEGLDAIINDDKNIPDYRLKDIFSLYFDLRRYRNCVVHRQDLTSGQGKFKDKSKQLSNLEFYLRATEIDPVQMREIFQRFLKIISINEDFDRIYDESYFNYYLTTVEERDFLTETESDFVRSLLDLKAWKNYIDVSGVDNYGNKGIAIELLIEFLQDGASIVAVMGEGGLGKTALTHEFIKRVTNKYSNIELSYNRILFFTSKSTTQGEFASTLIHLEEGIRTLNPHNPELGLAQNFIANFEFDRFYNKVCQLDRTKPPSVEHAMSILNENKYLLVIDNYEDVIDEGQKGKYQKFFRGVSRGKSSIIITTRNKSESSDTIALNRLEYPNAMEFLKQRFDYMRSKVGTMDTMKLSYREQDYNMILQDETKSPNLLERIRLTIDEDKQHWYDRSMQHPLALCLLVDFLFSPKTRERLQVKPQHNLVEYIEKVAKDPQIGLTNFIKDMREWSIEKSYDHVIKNNESCMLILTLLLESSTPLTPRRLTELFIEHKSDPNEVPDAIHMLLIREGDYLVRVDDPEAYELTEITRGWLNKQSKKPQEETRKQHEPKAKIVVKQQEPIFLIDQKELLSLHQMLEDEDIDSFRQAVSNCAWIHTSRVKQDIQNLNIVLVILNTLSHRDEDFESEKSLMISRLQDVLLPCLKENKPNQIYNSDDTPASINQILSLSLYLTAVHETNPSVKKEWINYSADDILREGHTINQQERELLFDELMRDSDLFPTGKDDIEYVISWLRLVSVFVRGGFFNHQNMSISRRILETIKELNNDFSLSDEIESTLDTTFQETIANFIDTWTSLEQEWDINSRTLRWSFEIEQLPSADDPWNGSSSWRIYTHLPELTIESIKNSPYIIEIYDIEGNLKIDPIQDTTYYTSLERIFTHNYPPIMRVRCLEAISKIDRKPVEGIDAKTRDKLISTCKECIIAGVKSSVISTYSHTELKQDYSKAEGKKLESVIRSMKDTNRFSNSREFVIDHVITEFERISVRHKGKPSQCYVRFIESSDEEDNIARQYEIEQQLIQNAQQIEEDSKIYISPTWLKISENGLKAYFEGEGDLSKCMDSSENAQTIRRIKEHYSNEYDKLKNTFQELINEGMDNVDEIIAEALQMLGCDDSSINFFHGKS